MFSRYNHLISLLNTILAYCGLKTKLIRGLKALNVDEIIARLGEDNIGNANGHFMAGLGVPRLETYIPFLYVTVAVRDCPIVYCSCHGDKQMILRRTTNKTEYNPQNHLFYICTEIGCDFNAYIVYPISDFFNDRRLAN